MPFFQSTGTLNFVNWVFLPSKKAKIYETQN